VHKTEDTIVDAGLDNDISLREGDIGTRAVNPDGSLENKPNSFEDGFPLDKQTEDINATVYFLGIGRAILFRILYQGI